MAFRFLFFLYLIQCLHITTLLHGILFVTETLVVHSLIHLFMIFSWSNHFFVLDRPKLEYDKHPEGQPYLWAVGYILYYWDRHLGNVDCRTRVASNLRVKSSNTFAVRSLHWLEECDQHWQYHHLKR